jgi:hypothetical protein
MLRYIVIALVLAVIGVPAWQIGMITLEKKQVAYLIQEQANKIKKYDNVELVKNHLKEELKNRSLPTEFTMKELARRKIQISYRYSKAASVFGHTYWQTAENFEAVTEE